MFADPHVQERGPELTMDYRGAASGKVNLLTNPLKLSKTQVTCRYAPPKHDEHQQDVLADWLGRANGSNDD